MSRSAPWPAIMVSYARRVMGTQPLPRPQSWLARFAQFFVFSHHRHRRSEVSRCKHDEENRHGAPPRPNPATIETRPRAVHKPTAVMFVFCCSPSLVALPSGDAVQTWGSVYEVSSDRSGENVRHIISIIVESKRRSTIVQYRRYGPHHSTAIVPCTSSSVAHSQAVLPPPRRAGRAVRTSSAHSCARCFVFPVCFPKPATVKVQVSVVPLAPACNGAPIGPKNV